jgi:hypothetical protein
MPIHTVPLGVSTRRGIVMPKDAALGKALAETLNGSYLGKIKSVQFTYDAYIEFDNLPAEPVVFITLDNSPWVRESRSTFRRDTALRVTMVTEANPTLDQAWVDQYLDSFDQLVGFVSTTPVNGLVPVDIESEDRYDIDRLQSHHRLVMDVLLNYRNIG